MQTEPLDDILFGVRRSVRYHQRRRALFDNLVLLTNGASVILGSAAVWSFWAKTDTAYGVYAALLVTVLSSINLVMGGSQRARLHADLARRFITLEREIALVGESTEEQRRLWCAKRLEIEGDEPPILRVIDIECHNELARSMGEPHGELYKIPGWIRITGYFSNWFEDRIRKYKDLVPAPIPK